MYRLKTFDLETLDREKIIAIVSDFAHTVVDEIYPLADKHEYLDNFSVKYNWHSYDDEYKAMLGGDTEFGAILMEILTELAIASLLGSCAVNSDIDMIVADAIDDEFQSYSITNEATSEFVARLIAAGYVGTYHSLPRTDGSQDIEYFICGIEPNIELQDRETD